MKKLILSLILLLGVSSYVFSQNVNDFYRCQVYSGGNVYTVAEQEMRADKSNPVDDGLEYVIIARSTSDDVMIDFSLDSQAGFQAHMVKIFLKDGTELQYEVNDLKATPEQDEQENDFRIKISYEELKNIFESKKPYEIIIVDEDWNTYIFKDKKSQYKKIRKGMSAMFEDIAQARAQGRVSAPRP